jgi:sulfur-carrier protein
VGDGPGGPGGPADRITVTVRYFAAARAAAGVREEVFELDGPADLAAVLQLATDHHGAPLARVLRRCSFLVDEVATHGPRTTMADGAIVDVLPPFAGG